MSRGGEEQVLDSRQRALQAKARPIAADIRQWQKLVETDLSDEAGKGIRGSEREKVRADLRSGFG